MKEFKLHQKIFVTGKIETITGMMVGGSKSALDIGGIDSPVIKTPRGIPYIPGSSLKGKLRSLIERKKFDLTPLKRYWESSKTKEDKKALKAKNWMDVGGGCIHSCSESDCEVCIVFGRPAENTNSEPTRFYARDSWLCEEDFRETFPELVADGFYIEAKWEDVIDRLTSAANPRQVERVPAGAKFDFEFVFNIFDEKDEGKFQKVVLSAMELLEDDFLGGMGSRGYG